jgi:myo-inositol-1(or 4)-monophosphatase
VTEGLLKADLDLLRGAIAEAGELALAHFRSTRSHWYKGPGQVVTAADLEVDALLKDALLSARPGYGWLSEESVDTGARLERARVWVVDPIDGTRAFADRIPEFAISVALLEDARPVLGIVLNPATGEHFEAVRGGGASLNGAPLATSPRQVLTDARLLSSRGEMKKRRWSEAFVEAKVRAIGSLAYKLALVAAGRADGLVSLRRTHDWDIAAAHLLLEEAGGGLTLASGEAITYNRPEPRHQGLAAAATPALHGELVARLARLQPS